MKDFINKIYQNHSLVYKVFLLILTTVSIIYLFPKGGQFKYEFRKGKPWQYENFYAPFDFAIRKSSEEISTEKKNIETDLKFYFRNNTEIVKAVNTDYAGKIDNLLHDSIFQNTDKEAFKNFGYNFLKYIYNRGYLADNSAVLQQNKQVTIIINNTAEDI